MLFKQIKLKSFKQKQNRTQPLASLLLARMVKLKQRNPKGTLSSLKKKLKARNPFNKSLTQSQKVKSISDNLKDKV
jgi:hypothetical protein